MSTHKNNQKLPPELERYLALCERTFQRMVKDGTWPWAAKLDSTESQDLVESDDNNQEL